MRVVEIAIERKGAARRKQCRRDEGAAKAKKQQKQKWQRGVR